MSSDVAKECQWNISNLTSVLKAVQPPKRSEKEAATQPDFSGFDHDAAWIGVLTTIDNSVAGLQTWLHSLRDQPSNSESYHLYGSCMNMISKRTKKIIPEVLECATLSSADRAKKCETIRTQLLVILDLVEELQSLEPTDLAESARSAHEQTANDSKQEVSRLQMLTDHFKTRLESSTILQQRVATFSSNDELHSIRAEIGKQQYLWAKMPLLDGWSSKNVLTGPHDGHIFEKRQIDEARLLLQAFCAAWKEITPHIADEGKFQDVQRMPMIAMILHHLPNGHVYFDRFVHTRQHDAEIAFDDFKLRNIFKPSADAQKVGELFAVQQFRAKPKEWPEGAHLTFDELMPLPLKFEEHFSTTGHYSIVDKVRDLTCHPPRYYARKSQRAIPKAREHLVNEIETLKRLRHRHIVQYVKSYERGMDEYAFLVLPAADSNLLSKLNIYCQKKLYRPGLRPVLLRSFGCLSLGMNYLHYHASTRHRDIKPDNILCHNDQFIIADFGLAYHFDPIKGSGTKNNFTGTPEYIAPEALSPEKRHGRGTDVFSLGCTFLEILCALVFFAKDHVRACQGYHEHLVELNQWISRALEDPNGKIEPLKSLLNLSRLMVSEAQVRPTITEVISEVESIEQKSNVPLFCNDCHEELRHNSLAQQPAAGTQSESNSLGSGRSSQRSGRGIRRAYNASKSKIGKLLSRSEGNV